MSQFEPNRRSFLLGASALATAPLWTPPALAAAHNYKFRQGEFEITVLSDGYITLPVAVVASDAGPLERAAISRRLNGDGETAQVKANIPVLRRGKDVILVDVGSGDKFQPTVGKLVANMRAAGIDPKSVTKVVFTHAHVDHMGGVTGKDGKLLFPNATYYVPAAEWDFWMAPDIETKLPKDFVPFAKMAQRDLGSVKPRVQMVKPGDDIVTGLRVISMAGHTPGHVALEVAGKEGLLITGDSLASDFVSFQHPEWKFGFDIDPDLAIKNRSALIDRVATDKTKLLGYHWAYPGVGYAERKDSAYRFVPAA